MSHRSRVSVLIALFVGLCVAIGQGVASADPAPRTLTGAAVVRTAQATAALTLEGVVTTALNNNPQVTAAQEAVVAAEQRLIQAGAGYVPTVSVTGTTSYGTAATTTTGTPTSDPRSSSTVSLTGTVTMYDNGRTHGAIDQAQANLAGAQATLRQTAQDIALSAGTAFFNVLRAQQVATVRAAQLEKAQGQLQLSQAQVRAGTAAEADIIQAQAQVAQAQVDLLAARSQIETTKGILRGVLAMDLFTQVEVREPAFQPAAITLTAEAVVKEAEENRAEIAKAIADIRASTAALAIALANAGFQVTAGLNGAYVISSTVPGLTNSTGWALSATVSFPLFDGGRGEALIKEAEANLRAAQAKAETVRISIRQDAYQAILAVVQARANVEATATAQTAADAALRVAEGRYRAGVGTILEVTTSRALAAQAEVNAITARYDQQAALANLRHALGRPIVGGTL